MANLKLYTNSVPALRPAASSRPVSEAGATGEGVAQRSGGLGFALLLAAALLVLWLAKPAAAVDVQAAIEGRLVSASADPASGGTSLLYTSPDRGLFVLTQACTDHPAVYVEADSTGQRLTFGNAGCTYFDPGLVMRSGERLRCVNRSGLSESCSIMGIHDPAGRSAPRPKIVDAKG